MLKYFQQSINSQLIKLETFLSSQVHNRLLGDWANLSRNSAKWTWLISWLEERSDSVTVWQSGVWAMWPGGINKPITRLGVLSHSTVTPSCTRETRDPWSWEHALQHLPLLPPVMEQRNFSLSQWKPGSCWSTESWEGIIITGRGFHYYNLGLWLSCLQLYFEQSWFSRELVSQRETQ